MQSSFQACMTFFPSVKNNRIYSSRQVHIYLDTSTICIILAADQNIFKLQLYNKHGIKVQTLIFNLRVFSSKLEERLSNYSSLICVTELKGTISN